MNRDLDTVLAYHAASKHDFHAYAPGPGGLDWANQPDPFRRYAGAPLLPLDRPGDGGGPDYERALFEGGVRPEALDRALLSQLLYDSLALSAWKLAGGTRWSLRVNPSSGNLHPTEGYVLCGPVAGLNDTPMLCHYAPAVHGLERRAGISATAWAVLTAGLPRDAVLIGLSSIPWREAWKYGQRAFRYCQHDVGHALAAVAVAAAGLGWVARLWDEFDDDTLRRLLALPAEPGPDDEVPECLLVVHPQSADWSPPVLSGPVRDTVAEGAAQGNANRLSASYRSWPLIDTVLTATRRPAARPAYLGDKPALVTGLEPGDSGLPLRRLVRSRRSAVAMDGRTGLTRAAAYQMLLRAMPGAGQFPFNALPWSPRVHLLLFVHRVQDLDPGMYLLARDPAALPELRRALDPEFAWTTPPGCPSGLPLRLLETGDARDLAARLSCHQDIAADGVLSIAMLAEFEPALRRYGAWFYRRLYWECGAIGQLLYLEAEASGIRATGIGCFFDDPVHRALGLTDRRYQSLYHFTVGAPVEDTRLTTLPAYDPVA